MEPDPEPNSSQKLHPIDDLLVAAKFLNDGKVIVYPTETFYGLIAGAFHVRALLAIHKLKNRPTDSPMPILIAQPGDLSGLTTHVTHEQQCLIDAYWPGPLTLVFEATNQVPGEITGGTGTIGVRVSEHRGARELAKLVGPLVATSANPSGQEPINDPDRLRKTFPDLPIFDQGLLTQSRGSTVVDVRAKPICFHRYGDISKEAIEITIKKTCEERPK
jgi:L-threonylcarbamoyladenylate synthase